MTKREFFTTIANMEGIADELKEMANAEIKAIEEAAEKAAEKRASKRAENQPLFDAVVPMLNPDTCVTASEVATALEVSTQKASYLLRTLVADGIAVDEETKGKNGKCKGYKLKAE